MSKLKNTIMSGVVMVLIAFGAGGVLGIATTNTSVGACEKFLTFPAWYEGVSSDCKSLDSPGGDLTLEKYIWTIVLNIVEIMLQAVAYLAVGFMIYAGFQYMTTGSSPDGRARALKTILNASIGLAIAISAVAVKNLVWDNIITAGGPGAPVMSAGTIVANLLNLAYLLVAIIAVIAIIIASISMATSAGDPGKAAKARTTIMSAVIGIVVVIIAFAVTQFIMGRFYG